MSDATPAPSSGPVRPALWRALLPWLLLAAVVVVLDQITKVEISATLNFAERIPVIAGFFDLTLLYNRGAAFSFLADAGGWQHWLFTGVAVLASVFILTLLVRYRHEPLFSAALALVLGGAIGNLLDRLMYGHVVDFLLFYHGNWSFPAFNLADSAITIGAILLLLHEFLHWRQTRQDPPASA